MSESVGRAGPLVTLEVRCTGCRYRRLVRYRAQGDSGYDAYCQHPQWPQEREAGDSADQTPSWCPEMPAELKDMR